MGEGCCEMLSPGRDVAIALVSSWQLSLPHTDCIRVNLPTFIHGQESCSRGPALLWKLLSFKGYWGRRSDVVSGVATGNRGVSRAPVKGTTLRPVW